MGTPCGGDDSSCKITLVKADANDDANSNIAFIQGEPAGSFSVITACAGFDESDEFDFGTQRYVSFARPGS